MFWIIFLVIVGIIAFIFRAKWLPAIKSLGTVSPEVSTKKLEELKSRAALEEKRAEELEKKAAAREALEAQIETERQKVTDAIQRQDQAKLKIQGRK